MNPSVVGEGWSVLAWRRGLGYGRYQETDEIHLSDGYISLSLLLGVFETQTGFKLTATLLHHPLAVPPKETPSFLAAPGKSMSG